MFFPRLQCGGRPHGRARGGNACITSGCKTICDGPLVHLNDRLSEARKGDFSVQGVQRKILALCASECRSEEHTSELQSLMRISYAVFCLKKKRKTKTNTQPQHYHTINTTELI